MIKESYAATHYDVSKLVCYGCAHSSATEEYPSVPSGERPCCYCIRNPKREEWIAKSPMALEEPKLVKVEVFDHDDKSLGFDERDFNPFTGHLYNGEEAAYVPMDNYVTIDQSDQEEKRSKGKFPNEAYVRIVQKESDSA